MKRRREGDQKRKRDDDDIEHSDWVTRDLDEMYKPAQRWKRPSGVLES
jgi:hypothetical protein